MSLSMKQNVVTCLLATLLFLPIVTGTFKMTNLRCESFNKTWMQFNTCRLRAVRRGVSEFNMNLTVFHPAHQINVNLAVVKKEIGYRPFLVNFTLDACEFMVKRSNIVGNVIYRLFENFTNINHTCPYEGDQVIDGFYLQHNLLDFPLPNGEYGLLMTWYFHRAKVCTTHVYFEFQKS